MSNSSIGEYTVIVRHKQTGRSISYSANLLDQSNIEQVCQAFRDTITTLIDPHNRAIQLSGIDNQIAALLEQKRLIVGAQTQNCNCNNDKT